MQEGNIEEHHRELEAGAAGYWKVPGLVVLTRAELGAEVREFGGLEKLVEAKLPELESSVRDKEQTHQELKSWAPEYNQVSDGPV